MTGGHKAMSASGTIGTFLRVGTCSETLCTVLDRAYGHPLRLEERASAPLAGGIMSRGYQCGQVWGAALAAGAQAFRLLGPGPRAEAAAIIASQRLVESFRSRYRSIDCRAIIGVDLSEPSLPLVARYFLKNGVRCFSMAARYAPVAFEEVNAALAAEYGEAPAPPVSCAALVAQQMGASDPHIVMAAGLAGGIGLSGDACGALGAAMWITDMNDRKHGVDKVGFKSPRVAALLERFADHTGSKFECLDIVGRRFESVADHAAYLSGGGCAGIIEALAEWR
jgi:hypothetical protein